LPAASQSVRAALDLISRNASIGVTVGHLEAVELDNKEEGMSALEKGPVQLPRIKIHFDLINHSLRNVTLNYVLLSYYNISLNFDFYNNLLLIFKK
jgi:hypothetical protein